MAGRADGGDDLVLVEGQLCVLVEDVLPAFLVSTTVRPSGSTV